MKIDVFAHILPPRYLRERNQRADARFATQYARYASANRGLTDLDLRWRILDKYPDVRQILTIAGPNIESVTTPAVAVECARIANDELATLVDAHPDRFIGEYHADPTDIMRAVRGLQEHVEKYGFKVLRIEPFMWRKPPTDRVYYPLYAKCVGLDVAFQAQVGHTGPL